MNKRIRPALLILTAFLTTTPGWGQSYFNALFMDQLTSIQARDLALAGANTSEYSSAMNSFQNPANQSSYQGIRITAAFDLLRVNENRSFPAIDQFGDRVTENIYVVSQGGQQAFAMGATWGAGDLGVSLLSAPFLTPNFTYLEEIRGSLYAPNINRDPLIGYHHMSQSGVIQASGLSAGYGLGSWSLGLGARFLHGMGLENQYGISVLDSADVSALGSGTTMLMEESWDLDNSPLLLNVGVVVDLNLHWRLSASYQSGYTLESFRQGALPMFDAGEDLPLIAWASDTVGVTIETPARFEIGLRMKPKNPLPTAVFVSVDYQDWSQYAVSYDDSLGGSLAAFDYPMQEAFSFRGGIEHWVNDNVPFRAGLMWSQSPIAGELSQSRFSAGSGWVSGPLTFDIAVQLYAVHYSFSDIFVPVNLSANPSENVRETQTVYSISLSYEW